MLPFLGAYFDGEANDVRRPAKRVRPPGALGDESWRTSATQPERNLQRHFECSRLEDQLWAMAYEQIWPVVRKSLKRSAGPGRQVQEPSSDAYIARRA